MTARRGKVIASTGVAMAVVATVVVSTGAEAAASRQTATPTATPTMSLLAASERPRGAVEDCSRSPGWPVGSAREFTQRWNLVVGPLALEGAGVMLGYAANSGGVYEKLLVHVRGGHRVTLELSRETRMDVGFGFGSPLGATRGSQWNLRNARRVVTFSACQRDQRSLLSGEWPVTGWVGWLLASSPRCVPLLAWVDDEPSPRRMVIRFGVRSCE